MRPALLRLLKRPSAVSVLDSLISTPIGIEQLESRYRCLRHHPRQLWQKPNLKEVEFESESSDGNESSTIPTRPPPRFRVHEIEPPQKDTTCKEARKGSDITAQDQLWSLGLQPEILEFESDVGHTEKIGEKLVDDPARRQDFALWEELLRYRQRHYGDKGTLEIWEGLVFRADGVQLPVHGERADLFWGNFVDLGFRREIFMKELERYAFDLWKSTGKKWDKFYHRIVAGFLDRGMVQQAVAWHKKLQHPHLNHPDDILKILQPAISLDHHQTPSQHAVSIKQSIAPGVRAFKNICRSTNGHHIYGPVISQLLQAGLAKEAMSMHAFLIQRNDHPERLEDIQPLLEYAMDHTSQHALQKLQEYADERFAFRDVGPDDHDPSAAKKTKRAPKLDDPEWMGEKPFKDDFGARLFATKAFNFDMILSGLRMFGVTAIGPQSLREMAVRAHGSQDILDKIRLLQESNISIGDSVLARLISKLAAENRDILLSDLLHSDQHPDMLEDGAVQESMLVSSYMARDWRQYQMTQAILGEISGDDPTLSNTHFRKFIASGEFPSAIKVVDAMSLRGQTLTSDSINFLIQKVLSPRKQGVGPPVGPGINPRKETTSVFRILQRVVPLGSPVGFDLWVEILKRFGMTNCWEELRDCSLWLARHYSFKPQQNDGIPWTTQPDTGAAPLPLNHGSHMLETILNHQMQTAIVTWGFRMRLSSNPETKAYNPFGVEGERLVPWVRGLVLLRELQQNGVPLAVKWIRRTCRHRLAVLFGRPRLSSRHMNRMLRRENPYDIHRVIQDMNRAWGGSSLFGGRENRNLHRLVNPPSSRMSQRKTRRSVWRATQLRGGAFARTR